MEDRGDALLHEDPAVHAFMEADAAGQARILASWGMDPAVALIVVNTCENACFFCANPGTTAVPDDEVTPADRIAAHLAGRPDDVETLLIGGNEPMLHPWFEDAMTRAWALGYRRVELMTSGLRLTPQRVASLVARGLSAVAVPIYSTEGALHDAVCGARCYDRLVAGLDAAVAAGVRVDLHTLVLRRTLHTLPDLVRMCRERWGARLAVAPLRDKAGLFAYDDEAVPLSALHDALAGLDVSLLGMPDCLLPDAPRGSAPIIDVYFRTQLRAFGGPCAGCARRSTCRGVVLAEIARHGGAGLRPFR